MTHPNHAARPAPRRPRLWHALAVAALGAWILAMLIRPSSCDAIAANSPSITPPSPPTTTAPAWARSPVPINARPGLTASDFVQCEIGSASGGDADARLERLECMTDRGLIAPVPQYESWKSSVASAESSYASATSSAASAQSAADTKHRAELDRCTGSRGGLSSTLQVVAFILSIAAAFAGWRRVKEVGEQRANMQTAFGWDRTYPPGSEIHSGDRELAAAINGAERAAAELEKGSVVWFGGDGSGAEELRGIALRASREQGNRERGHFAAAPVYAPTEDPEIDLPDGDEDAEVPVAQDASDWVSKLQSKGDEW
ncbi:hypothetical protein MFAL_29340 [Mycolicibacterium fallax]|nr:hypothetical protein MFAL_29340 [Mycolicibacterium fallax]